MAKGPFGNPLSTGIALSGVIDMVTPVRQAQERKRKRQAEEKAAQDKRAKELGSIMGKIAIDEDKIWWRYHDDARSQYANTIDKVQQMYSAGDYAGMYKTINDFDSRMANYTQATTQKNEWKKSVEKGDKYYDQSYLNALENRDVGMAELVGLADQSGFGMYDKNTNILGFINPVDRVDLRASMKKAVEGQKFEYDKAGKKLDVVGYGANIEPVYRMSLQDKDNTINAVKNSISPQAIPYMLMELGYSRDDQTKMTPTELARTLDQELDKVYGLYSTQEQMGSKPTATKKDYERPGVIGNVQIAEATPSSISKEAFNFESYKKRAVPFIESEIFKIIENSSGNEGKITSELKLKGLTKNVLEVDDSFDAFGMMGNNISVGGVTINIDDPKKASKQIADELSKINDSDFKSIASNFEYSEATPTEIVKDFEKTATINVFGRDIKKTFKIPKGTIYIVGSKGSKKVNTLNSVDVSNSTFRTVNRDKQNDIWHGIDFPIEEESAIKQILNEALGKSAVDDFVKSNGIPKTFIVPEIDENIQTLQTLDKKLTPDFLKAELKKIGVYGSGTTSTSSNGGANTPSFQ